ncbi:H/ACA ribonucleoprotein complex non-core subunit NAF1-like, partial [Branchiostoma floridae]|uniref:H/ACA ribonucleoprotein complex non-core subunit NAF1 n=1 Tax=Branchiostoma floridae TaxID=7739 RepID=A0A9J7KXA7_BRAFL
MEDTLNSGINKLGECYTTDAPKMSHDKPEHEDTFMITADKGSLIIETEKESHKSTSNVVTKSQEKEVTKNQSSLIEKDIVMETEEERRTASDPSIDSCTDVESKDETSQLPRTKESGHSNDVEVPDNSTVTQEMTPMKVDALDERRLSTKTNTQQELSKDRTEDMETENGDAVQGLNLKEQDVTVVKGTVEVREEKGESLEDSKEVAETSESESSSSDESESSSDSSDEDEEEEEVKNEKPKQDQPPPAKEELVVTQGTEDVAVDNFPDIILPEDVHVKVIGKISCIIGQLVVVQSYPNTPALDAETLLFNSDRQSIGLVNETFGPVIQPSYSIQFSSAKKIEALGLSLQNEVFFAPEVQDFTVYVFTQNLIKQKGSDASWKNDQEPPPEFLDYSDDEQEKVAKKNMKEAKGKKPKPRKAFKRDQEVPRTDSGHPPCQNYQGPGQHSWRGGYQGYHGNKEQWCRQPEQDFNFPRYPPPPFQGPPPGPPPPFHPPPFGWNQPHALGGMNVQPPNYGPPPPHGHHVNHPPPNMRLPFPPPPPPPPSMRDGQVGGGPPPFHPHHYSGPPPQEMFP